MGSGYVGILSADLHFPESNSLKSKRKHVQSVKAQVARRFGASVAEVDHHDMWQRCRLTLACTARQHAELVDLLDGVERYLWSQPIEVAQVDRDIVKVGE